MSSGNDSENAQGSSGELADPSSVPSGNSEDTKFRKTIHRLLFASGVIGIVGLDQDVVRWSLIANWAVELYRNFAGWTREIILNLLHIPIDPLVLDLIYLGLIFLAAANAYSLRRYGMLTLLLSLKLFWMEQIVRKSSDDFLGKRVMDQLLNGRRGKILTLACALAGIAIMIHLFLRLVFWMIYGVGPWWRALELLLSAYLVIGFLIISVLDDQVPADDPDRFETTEFYKYVGATVLFLPSAVMRHCAFMIYCVLFSVLLAWRWYIMMFAVVLAILALNEVYFRFAHDWGDARPDCILLSVQRTCAMSSQG